MQKTEGFVHLADARIYYQEAGRGLPVVMIHCGALNHRVWDGQFGVFSKKHRAVRYDCRNHGLSMGSEVSGGHCDDLHQLLESLEIKKAVLVGLAMGAGIAMDMALRDPARVSGLVLVSPGFSQDQERDNNLRRCQKEYLEALDKHDHEAMVECFQRSWTDGPYRSALQVPPQLREKVHSMALKTVGRWQEGSLGLCRGDRLIKSSFDIRQPALLVVGNLNTPEILDTADVLLRRIRNSRKIVVPHVGHLVNMEAPEQFNNLTLEFINQIEGGKNEIR